MSVSASWNAGLTTFFCQYRLLTSQYSRNTAKDLTVTGPSRFLTVWNARLVCLSVCVLEAVWFVRLKLIFFTPVGPCFTRQQPVVVLESRFWTTLFPVPVAWTLNILCLCQATGTGNRVVHNRLYSLDSFFIAAAVRRVCLYVGKSFEITYVRLKFHSSRPESFAIYKRTTQRSDWQPWQFYSSSCQETYSLPVRPLIRRDDEARAICRDDFSDISPLTGASVAFSTLEGRPGAYNFENSAVLQVRIRIYLFYV